MPLVRKPHALPLLVGASLGHWWTIAHHVRRTQRAPLLEEAEPFEVTIPDPLTSSVTLRGALHSPNPTFAEQNRDLVVLIHGLGGSAQSGYMLEATANALALGFAVLRVNLRGADVRGTDFYHAGLYTDVLAVLQHDAVQRHDNVYVLGVSLGGHVVLRTAGHQEAPPNLRAVAALCPPLDLAACSAAFDKKRQWVYRRHVLDGLKAMYGRFVAHHESTRSELSLPTARTAAAIGTIGEWDRSIVAPRHGFASAMEYYSTQSAGPRLGEIRVPTLVLTARWDPMVPQHTTAHQLLPMDQSVQPSSSIPAMVVPEQQLPAAETTSEWASTMQQQAPWVVQRLTQHVRHVELATGGHIAFPQRGEANVFKRTLTWLKQYAR